MEIILHLHASLPGLKICAVFVLLLQSWLLHLLSMQKTNEKEEISFMLRVKNQSQGFF